MVAGVHLAVSDWLSNVTYESFTLHEFPIFILTLILKGNFVSVIAES